MAAFAGGGARRGRAARRVICSRTVRAPRGPATARLILSEITSDSTTTLSRVIECRDGPLLSSQRMPANHPPSGSVSRLRAVSRQGEPGRASHHQAAARGRAVVRGLVVGGGLHGGLPPPDSQQPGAGAPSPGLRAFTSTAIVYHFRCEALTTNSPTCSASPRPAPRPERARVSRGERSDSDVRLLQRHIFTISSSSPPPAASRDTFTNSAPNP